MTVFKAIPLTELCLYFGDGDWIESKDQAKSGIRLLQTGNVGDGFFKDRVGKARYISKETFDRLRCTTVNPGDCLISRLPDPVGRSCLVPPTDEPMITAVDCTIVRFKPALINPRFFTYFTQSVKYQEFVNSEATGTTRKRISRSKLGKVPIPVPPLAEQQRIVAILDEAFDAIATAKANTEKNLQNARELFDAILDCRLNSPHNGWAKTRIGSSCKMLGGGTPSKAKASFWLGDIPWVSPKDMKREVISDSIDHISAEAIINSATTAIPKGSILIVVRSGILARTIPIAITGRELTINQDIKAIVPPNFLNTKFMYFVLKNKENEFLAMVSKGATVHRLQTDLVKNLEFYYPNETDQTNLVTYLEEQRAKTDTLIFGYHQKLAALDELKKALLDQAFTGKL